MALRVPAGAVLAAAALASLALAGPAGAERLTTIETPSRYVDPATVDFNGPDHPKRLRANVLLPDGYDGHKRFPVVFLLHGAGDSYRSWANPEQGDIRRTAKGLEAIVVMPEADTGFYSNWWNDGRRGNPGWERFFLDELIPLVERRYRVRPGRRWHAIAGLSMGGFGATFLATQLPGYFGSASSFSGFVNPQHHEAALALRVVAGIEYDRIYGPVTGFYAAGHNPTRLIENLRSTRLFTAVGNGLDDQGNDPATVIAGGVVELELAVQAREFVTAAREAGADVVFRPETGVHAWQYWRRHLREAITWGLFRPVAERPRAWSYRTVADHGRAWDLRYRFATPPTGVVAFARNGDHLRARGTGTVTIAGPGGRCFQAALPLDRTLPSSCLEAPGDEAPRITGLRLSSKRFRAGRRGGAVVPRGRRLGRRVGTRVRYRLARDATVAFRVERSRRGAGRLVGGRCVRRTARNAARRRCTRYRILRGSLTRRGRQGVNRLRLSGRWRGRRLRTGRYRLVARARLGSGKRSRPARVRFRIVR